MNILLLSMNKAAVMALEQYAAGVCKDWYVAASDARRMEYRCRNEGRQWRAGYRLREKIWVS